MPGPSTGPTRRAVRGCVTGRRHAAMPSTATCGPWAAGAARGVGGSDRRPQCGRPRTDRCL